MRRLTLPRVRLWWERAFWVIPLLGVTLGLLLHQLSADLDEAIARLAGPDWVPAVSASSAGQLLAAVGGSMVTFTGFVFSFVLLLLQFGSSQYSPRTVSYFLRARSTQWILGLFLLTVTFSFLGLLGIGSYGRDDFTPGATVAIAVVLLFASLVGFIVLLHSVGGRIRVDAVVSSLGLQARRQLPRRYAAPPGAEVTESDPDDDIDVPEVTLIRNTRATGQVVAVDGRRLYFIAKRHKYQVSLLIRVGDAVSIGTPIIAVTNAPAGLAPRVQRALRQCIVVDVERSLRYDPLYALRLLVDIALRALSPTINDPTTAVRAIDEIEEVLRVAATLRLGPRTLTAGEGQIMIRTPTWADVVDLALLEILVFGKDQPQVTRRLTALIDDLISDFPPHRDAPLLTLRRRLITYVTNLDLAPDITALVLRGDRQGLGGTR